MKLSELLPFNRYPFTLSEAEVGSSETVTLLHAMEKCLNASKCLISSDKHNPQCIDSSNR